MILPPASTETDILTWAKWYLSRGWRLVPLHNPIFENDTVRCSCKAGVNCGRSTGKHPRFAKWTDEATSDIKVVEGWLKRWPNMNLGGTPPVGCIAVDGDNYHNEGINPLDGWPATQTHLSGTGDGSEHKIYVDIEGRFQKQSDLSKAINTRLSGSGQLVLPPSIHFSGNRYKVSDAREPDIFPYAELTRLTLPGADTPKRKRKGEKSKFVELLSKPTDDESLGDNHMFDVCAYLARFVYEGGGSEADYMALANAVNVGIHEHPLDQTAMEKKLWVFRKHVEEKEKATNLDEIDARHGYLYEVDGKGYSTKLEYANGTVEFVAVTDFRLRAKGVVVEDDDIVFIVDIVDAQGNITHEDQHLQGSTLGSIGKTRDWFARKGLSFTAARNDKRPDLSVRLMDLLKSQEPSVLQSTDYYGWHDETQTLITDVGEITVDGEMRPYSTIFPRQNLSEHKSIHYGTEHSESEVRDHLKRFLALNVPLEMAKLGAWIVMQILKGQYKGASMPGAMTSAFSGTGKSTVYELVTCFLGYKQTGGKLTAPVFRDRLARSYNSAVWLDDLALTEDHKTTIRSAFTTGVESKMMPAKNGGFSEQNFPLRSSIIVTDEGNKLMAEKANVDRFMVVDLTTGYRTTDGEALKNLSIENGAGTLAMMVFKRRHMLNELEDIMATATNRAARWRCLLRIGAKILSDILGDLTYYNLVSEWCDRLDGVVDNSSMLVKHIIPRVWTADHNPTDHANAYHPVWWNNEKKVFEINSLKLSASWLARSGLSTREKQFGEVDAIRAELRACGTQGNGRQLGISKLRYVALPAEYSKIAYDIATGDDHPE